MADVSVCVPLYRPRPDHLRALVESVKAQSTPALEIVLSEDPSDVVLNELPDGPIRYYRNPERLGMVGNWNQAVSLTRGRFVILVGQDDLLAPDAIATHLRVLAEVPGVAMSSSLPGFVDALGNARPSNLRSVTPDRLFEPERTYHVPFPVLVDLALMYGNVSGEPCGSCFVKERWAAVSGYSPSFPHCADVEFALRMAAGGGLAITTRPLAMRRLHESNLTLSQIRTGVTSRDRHRLAAIYGPLASSDYVRARAEGRLVTHELFDALRTRGTRRPRVSGLRPTPRALLDDVRENLGGTPWGRILTAGLPHRHLGPAASLDVA